MCAPLAKTVCNSPNQARDKSLCWETYEPQTDSSVVSTGTSGQCVGSCYTSAYKYKVSANYSYLYEGEVRETPCVDSQKLLMF